MEQELVEGRKFSSFEELSTSIKKWEEANFVTLYTRSSRGVGTARRRAPRRTFAEKLKFSELDYAVFMGEESSTEEVVSEVSRQKVLFRVTLCQLHSTAHKFNLRAWAIGLGL